MQTPYPSRTPRQRLAAVISFLGFTALICAAGWWSPIAQVLQSREAVMFVGVWWVCLGAFLLPGFLTGVGRGICQFQSLFDDHDDDQLPTANTALQRTASGALMSIVLNFFVVIVAVTTGVEAAAELSRSAEPISPFNVSAGFSFVSFVGTPAFSFAHESHESHECLS